MSAESKQVWEGGVRTGIGLAAAIGLRCQAVRFWRGREKRVNQIMKAREEGAALGALYRYAHFAANNGANVHDVKLLIRFSLD